MEERAIDRIQRHYDAAQEELQQYLDSKEMNLGGKLALLFEFQSANGFVQDSGQNPEVFQRCKIPKDAGNAGNTDWPAFFYAQFNLLRSQRGKGAGRTMPPTGITPVNNNCFLCRENVFWQQRGLEFMYRLVVNGNTYHAMCNPFPLAPQHVTVVSGKHEPQRLIEQGSGKDEDRVGKITSDLLQMVSLAPDFIGFYNGLGAGASIPSHFHFQMFRRREGQVYPIELAAKLMLREDHQTPFVVTNYPIPFIYLSGRREEVCGQMKRAVRMLVDGCGDFPNLSVNVIAAIDHGQSQRQGDAAIYKLYLVPRDTDCSLSPGRRGVVGGLEVLGEIVFSEKAEMEKYEGGGIDYGYLCRILRAVESGTASDYLARFAKTLPSS